MAVSAYSSLLSLTHVLDNLHHRAPFHFPGLDLKQIETLQEKVDFLLQFSEHHSEMQGLEMKVLWRKMAEVAFEAEDMIDFHVVNQLHGRDQGEMAHKFSEKAFHKVNQLLIRSEEAFTEDMKRVISKIGVIREDLLSVIKEEEDPEDVHQAGKQPTVPVASSSSTASSTARNVIVGIDEHVVSIMDQLTGNQKKLQILPIVGMGGIGKTTLARSMFDHPFIINHFDMHIWLTISQEYNIHQILRGLLYDDGNKGTCESVAELGDRLYKKLFGRKYLIVMDDVWTTKAWDDLQRSFPENGNGSRVLLTTRLLDVAACLGSLNPYSLAFLDEDKSWELFCQVTFEQKGCPYVELEGIGRAIVRGCRGLPLEISVVGRLLANSNKTLEHWRLVAENISSFANLEDNEYCLKILSLSYKSLPMHLKPCFLYMRVFREDELILVSDLIDRWMAEGFIKQASDKSLEETAKHYLKDLIDRNLIFCGRAKNLEKIGMDFRQCGIHDLLRDLCLRESDKENFIESPKAQKFDRYSAKDACSFCSKLMERKESIDISNRVLVFPTNSTWRTISHFSCDACRRKYSHIPRAMFVRAMIGYCDMGWGAHFTDDIELPTESRYLQILPYERVGFLDSVHLLWNLQTLIVGHCYGSPTNLPSKVWEMTQLRRINFDMGGFYVPEATTHMEGTNFIVLKNLQSLSFVVNFKCATEVLNRVPNMKDLYIKYITDEDVVYRSMIQLDYSLCNLVQLQKLESLYIENASENISYPNSLKMLTLSNCRMVWKDVSVIGSLPNLEEVELHSGIEGEEWIPEEGEFLRLKKLRIQSTDLVRWEADSIHFPVLEELQLCNLRSLEEIPSGIGDIPTLHSIKLVRCNKSLIKSGVQIWNEQQSMENEIHFVVDGRPYKTGAFESLRIKDDI